MTYGGEAMTGADRLLREAGTNPEPRAEFVPYFGGHALFVRGRRRAWYRMVSQQPHLFDVYGNGVQGEVVMGEDVARDLCYEWTEAWDEKGGR